jgi:hypothetical protein
MKTTANQIGDLVKATRKSLAVTQKDLALTSGTGLWFIIELASLLLAIRMTDLGPAPSGLSVRARTISS